MMRGEQPRRAHMPRTSDDGPRSPLARYAFGWSTKKPDATFWAVVAGMLMYVVYRFATL